jgi:hypothetical protein
LFVQTSALMLYGIIMGIAFVISRRIVRRKQRRSYV